MKRFPDLLLAMMIGGIVVQIWIAAGRIPEGGFQAGEAKTLDVADTLPFVTGYSGVGRADTVFLGDEIASVTILYSFHPDCAHSRTLAHEWARHFDEVWATDAAVRSIAVTLAMPSLAQDFADRFGWQAEVISVAGISPLQREYTLVSRTPWVFVFDSHGVLLLHDHGSRLDRVEAAAARLLLE